MRPREHFGVLHQYDIIQDLLERSMPCHFAAHVWNLIEKAEVEDGEELIFKFEAEE